MLILFSLHFSCRFFASSDVTLAESNKSKEESDDRTEPDHALTLAGETHGTQRETEMPPQRASLSAFSWAASSTEHFRTGSSSSDGPRTPSMSLGLSVLQQFQRKKENISWGQTESPQLSLPCSPPEGAVDGETPPCSPPSQDSAYFSQSCSSHSVSEDSTTGTHSATTSPETVRKPDTTVFLTLCTGSIGVNNVEDSQEEEII